MDVASANLSKGIDSNLRFLTSPKDTPGFESAANIYGVYGFGATAAEIELAQNIKLSVSAES